jgi:hypothetical protein
MLAALTVDVAFDKVSFIKGTSVFSRLASAFRAILAADRRLEDCLYVAI